MNSIMKTLGSLSLAAAMLVAVAGCSSQPTATPTVEPSPTIAPTEVPAPTDVPVPTDATAPTTAPADQNTPSADANQSTQMPTQAAIFTAVPTGAKAPAISTQDQAQYVSQSVADGVQVLPGHTITITWAVKNVGTVAWTTNYTLRFFAGPPVTGAQSIPFPKTIAPDATANLTVSIVAPQQEGNYSSWWKLANEQGDNFSDVNLNFTVTNHPGSVPTATPAK